jgi:hypothetical protein
LWPAVMVSRPGATRDSGAPRVKPRLTW